MPGKGHLILTGSLGEVMRESVQAALSYIRSHAEILKIDPKQFETLDFHVHVPAGAMPKDGPSAGITMAVALASLLTRCHAVKPATAMTGEITLRGKYFPWAGSKKKSSLRPVPVSGRYCYPIRIGRTWWKILQMSVKK